jgi:hypothetical protein
MFHGITAERYLQIYNYARHLYNSRVEYYNKSELIIREIAKDIYDTYEINIGCNQDELKLFYLSLLVDNDEFLKDMQRLYEQYLEVTGIDNYKPLEYYEKYGQNEAVQIIIEMLKDYGISSQEVRDKVDSVINYYKANKLLKLYEKKQAQLNTNNKESSVNSNDIDLIAELKKFEKQNRKQDPYKYFILPEGTDILNEQPKAKK